MVPKIHLICGPNGAGKSTHARSILAANPKLEFLNADLVAAAIAGDDENAKLRKAGKFVLTRTDDLIAARETFVIESTLSGRVLARQLREVKEAGYEISATFIWIATAEMSLQRVRLRVSQGGHDVPEDAVRRRHRPTIQNFLGLYFPLFSEWRLIDNTDGDQQEIAMGLQETSDVRQFQALLKENR